jgi:hypothetical protein
MHQTIDVHGVQVVDEHIEKGMEAASTLQNFGAEGLGRELYHHWHRRYSANGNVLYTGLVPRDDYEHTHLREPRHSPLQVFHPLVSSFEHHA